MNHYIYRLDGPDGQFYFGSRSCRVLPENDVYMGSGVWPVLCQKQGITLAKTIVKSGFANRTDACEAEIDLVLQNQENPKLMNRSRAVQRFVPKEMNLNKCWQDLVGCGIIELGHLPTLLYISLVGLEKGNGISEKFLSKFCTCTVEQVHDSLTEVGKIISDRLPKIYNEANIWYVEREGQL